MGICIFCGEDRPLTKEHMVPNWYRREFAWRRPKSVHVIEGFREGSGVYAGKGRIGHAGDIHDRGIRCVCAECNNGWMSGLQEQAMPFLREMIVAGDTRVPAAAAPIIMRWLCMATCVWETADPPTAVLTATQRREIMAGAIPAGWFGCVGRTHDLRQSGTRSHRGLRLSDDSGPRLAAQVTIFCLYPLLFYSASIDPAELGDDGKPTLAGSGDARVNVFWPFNILLQVQTTAALDEAAMYAVRDAILPGWTEATDIVDAINREAAARAGGRST